MKKCFNGFICLLFLNSLNAEATVLVNAPPPSLQHVIGDVGNGVYYAAGTGGRLASGAYYNASLSFPIFDTSVTSGIVLVDVSTDKPPVLTRKQVLVVTLSVAATSGDEIPLTGASLASGSGAPILCNSNGQSNCLQQIRNGTTYNFSALYSAGSVLRLSFSLSDLCATPGVTFTAGSSICASSSTLNNLSSTTLTQSLFVTFSAIDTTVNPIGSVSGGEAISTSINLTDVAPSIACPVSPNIEDFYYPGDQSIIFNSSNYPTTTNGAPLQSIVVLADRSAVPVVSANTLPAAEVVAYIGFTGDKQVANGFVNSTNGTDNGYKAALYAMNTAGILSPPGTACTTNAFPRGRGDGSADGLLRAQSIKSVLTESKCFIATAAFHDGRAPPVMLLRKFRNEVLSKNQLGRSFIEMYYHYSPALAEWAWDKPLVRAFALHFLAPLEMIAWTILKFTQAEEAPSIQPYIDRVKKKLEETNTKHESNDSFIEAERKKLPPSSEGTESSFIDKVKKTLPEEKASGENYSSETKALLPPEKVTESPIERVKEGRDQLPRPERPLIKNAVSILLGVNPGISVENSKSFVKFSEMYGLGWQPDFLIRYERQLFHSENYGSFGVGVDMGVSYAEGFGQYNFGFGSLNSKQSRTKFSFLQIPLSVSSVYRFNLLRFVRPYAGASIGSINYTEIRSDAGQDKRGFAIITQGKVGVSLLLDILDRKTSMDGFLANGIQHTYLFAEYLVMRTVLGLGVTFERSGVYLGFLFEY